MRHIIVHLIKGAAQEAHEAITRDLAKKFDSFPLHDRIPPHLTLKRWFELDGAGMETLYKTLDGFAARHRQSGYELKGFGHFGTDVVYVDVLPSAEMSATAAELITELRTVPGMTFDEFDNGGEFHATLAMAALKPFDYEQIWNYLQANPQLNFSMRFDNIAVLKKSDDQWIVDRVWELKS